ncbi:hypothetical protein [Phenylobacterium sp. SCN 70-31]|uniref:hypothetical protein n=1 Tax=Phenylobacterium sp. SCN 70-31 TaxID=1660129 RepID=UPI00086F0CCE|nr:hypothetical protein [Phenylobacterium sp. SCN 70-31]ODT84757.1 MAG: hypothetical protein ABS78_22175 [Phenylobacterium sp. SCN 70-31]
MGRAGLEDRLSSRRSGRTFGLRVTPRAGAALVSVGVHAVLAVVLARHLAAPSSAPVADPPAMRVSLIPPVWTDWRRAGGRPTSEGRAASERSASRRPAPDNANAPLRDPAARPEVDAREVDAPAVGAPDVSPRWTTGGESRAGGPSGGLRGLRDCERAGLSRQAREACETSRWAGAQAAPARLNLDPAGRYAEPLEPFLSRRPTRGCRLRATGDADARGDSGHARAGFTCVVPF